MDSEDMDSNKQRYQLCRLLSKNWYIAIFNVSDYAAQLFLCLLITGCACYDGGSSALFCF